MPDGFSGGGEGDLRFQFEVIKNLAESVRQQSDVLRSVQTTQVTMLERLAKIEANRVNETVAELKVKLDETCGKVDRLESDKDRRDGGSAWRQGLMVYWPIAAVTISAVLWVMRVIGVLHLPTDPPVPK